MMINVTKASLPELDKYIEYLKRIWASSWLTNDGALLHLLEKRFLEYLKIDDLILVSNGTLALQLALRALELKGEVITTPFTFAATTNVILLEGLTPVFADIDPETFNIDPKQVEKKITQKTCAILATHVYGNPCHVEELERMASRYKIKLIYDAAHAFGVEYKNRSVLNWGDISTLSFHATKVFNTIEGGAVVINNDKKLIERVKLLRNHGIKSEVEVILPGINAKMNEFQAAMGLCNLDNIDENIRLRANIYNYYKDSLAGTNVKFQQILASRYNYIYMPMCFENVQKRDEIYSNLVKEGIKPRKYFYPLTVDFDYFKEKGVNLTERYNLKEASTVSDKILCLPLYPDLDIQVVDHIIEIVKDTI